MSGGLLAVLAVAAVDVATAGAALAQPSSAVVTGQAAAAAAKPKKKYYVPQGPRFNLPTGTKTQQGALDLYIKKLIRNAPKGSEINVALFRLNTAGMAKELVRAKKRKVKVRIVVDSDSLNKRRSVYDYLRKNLGTSTRRSSWIVLCPKGRGCIAPKVSGQWSKNHNKFYAFSRTYSSHNVVVQTSGNATGGMYVQYNDAYTMTDAKLYRAYRKYFYDLAKRRANGNYYRTYRSGSRAVTFFPKATGDPIADALDKVSCVGGTRLRLSSGLFTRSGVAKRLSRLDDAGCDVRLVSASFGESTLKALRQPGRNGGPQTRFFTEKQTREAHSKYLLIDGWYNGRRRKVVMTGSHSYTTAALRYNDEAMLTIESKATYDAYLRNFNRVFGAAAGRLYVLSSVPAPNVPTVPDNTPEKNDGEPETPAEPTAPQ
ncbi:phospholipase D-like domain-containing protein, partial [Actinomadura miaoliensis]